MTTIPKNLVAQMRLLKTAIQSTRDHFDKDIKDYEILLEICSADSTWFNASQKTHVFMFVRNYLPYLKKEELDSFVLHSYGVIEDKKIFIAKSVLSCPAADDKTIKSLMHKTASCEGVNKSLMFTTILESDRLNTNLLTELIKTIHMCPAEDQLQHFLTIMNHPMADDSVFLSSYTTLYQCDEEAREHMALALLNSNRPLDVHARKELSERLPAKPNFMDCFPT